LSSFLLHLAWRKDECKSHDNVGGYDYN